MERPARPVFAAAARSLLSVLVLLAAGLPGCSRQDDSGPTNVLLVTLDTCRRDHLGCYGGQPTPALDRLAREGILFANAMSQAPLTLPSHASILTGLYPLSDGVRDNGRFRLDSRFRTLAEMLHDHGYATGAAVGAFPVDSRFGLNQGFDYYDDDLSSGSGSGREFRERRAEEVNRSALSWLDTVGEKPFFLWVHYFDAHQPYDPPSPWREQYWERPYLGEIQYVDAQFDSLLGSIERRGLLERTLIVVLADHGEGLGDHGETTHGLFLYDPTIHIPFLLRPPDPLTRRVERGRTVTRLVESVDVVPTVLDLLGFPIPPGLDGQSDVALLHGDNPEGEGDRIGYAETFYPYFGFGWSELRAVRGGGWKYIAAPLPELYECTLDSQELRNLARSKPEETRRLSRALADLRKREHDTPAEPLDDETVAMLRSLGYVGSGGNNESDAGGRDSSHVLGAPPGSPDPKDMIDVLNAILNGEEFLSHGETKKAATLLRKAVRDDPRNETAHLLLAKTLMEMNLIDKAWDELKAVLVHHPDSPEAHLGLAAILIGRKDWDQAEQQLRKALAARPEFGMARYNLALVREARGDTEGAMSELHRAVDDSPYLVEAWTSLGELAFRSRKWDEARTAWGKALTISPENPQALRGLERLNQQQPAGHQGARRKSEKPPEAKG